MAARQYSDTAELEAYQRQNPRSAARFAEAQQVLAGGNSRLTAYFAPFPFYVERGEGCALYDLDGNRRLDFYNNATSLILGHCNPQVTAAVMAQATQRLGVCQSHRPGAGTGDADYLPRALRAAPALYQQRHGRRHAGHSCGARLHG